MANPEHQKNQESHEFFSSSTFSNKSVQNSKLDCSDFLAVVIVCEIGNINPDFAWKLHDENCDCELATASFEPLI